jgi:GNAT superfamily N-acetyltransferase
MAKGSEDISIQRLVGNLSELDIDQLALVLIDCVKQGASVSFMSPLSFAHARNFWERVAIDVAASKHVLMVARNNKQTIVGTAQAIFDLPDNQPHRADVAKMLVHSQYRRRGIAQALLVELEQHCLHAGKTTLVLDTDTNGKAYPMYKKLGWILVGDIPNFALMPDGAPCSTSFFYRDLKVK